MDYLHLVISGFTRIYRLLIAQREELLTWMLPLFVQDEIRIVLRPTNTYGRILQESLHPTLLHNALDRDRLLDLAALSGEERFCQAALAAIAYERSLFSQEAQNWPDLRPSETGESPEKGYTVMWCAR